MIMKWCTCMINVILYKIYVRENQNMDFFIVTPLLTLSALISIRDNVCGKDFSSWFFKIKNGHWLFQMLRITKCRTKILPLTLSGLLVTRNENPYGRRGELPTWLPMGCTQATERATCWNSAMQMRLPTTSKYQNNGQLSWQPMGILPCKYGWPQLPYIETIGSSVRQPTASIIKRGQLSGQWSWLPKVCM